MAGYRALHPGAFGVSGMDIHCRCTMIQRARWALDEEELKTMKKRAEYYGLDKTEQFEEFKRRYMAAVEDVEKKRQECLTFLGKVV